MVIVFVALSEVSIKDLVRRKV